MHFSTPKLSRIHWVPLVIINAIGSAYLISIEMLGVPNTEPVREWVYFVILGLQLGQLGTLDIILALTGGKSAGTRRRESLRGMREYGIWLLSCLVGGLGAGVLEVTRGESDQSGLLVCVMWLSIPLALLITSAVYLTAHTIVVELIGFDDCYILEKSNEGERGTAQEFVRFRLTHLLIATLVFAILALGIRSVASRIDPRNPWPRVSSLIAAWQYFGESLLVLVVPSLSTWTIFSQRQRLLKLTLSVTILFAPVLIVILGSKLLRLPGVAIIERSFIAYSCVQLGQLASITWLEMGLHRASYRLVPYRKVNM